MGAGRSQPSENLIKERKREKTEKCKQPWSDSDERREQRGDEGGFTLIELLIVIVILGILAAIVVFAVQNLTGSSAKASCGSDMKTVETAVEAYKAQLADYPGGTINPAWGAPTLPANPPVVPAGLTAPENGQPERTVLDVHPRHPDDRAVAQRHALQPRALHHRRH